jgi:citrate/tricarballylate utilization protein
VLSPETLAEAQHVMTVCNACRYCEAYCPVFQAMENRTAFAKGDILYLSNLCHNCGECLYACQYAPPHEFNINVPRVLAEARVASYEEYAWPNIGARGFRRAFSFALGSSVVSMIVLGLFVRSPSMPDDFYAVISHEVMVGIFSLVALFCLTVLAVGFRRAIRDFGPPEGGHYRRGERTRPARAIRDVLTLRHLHATGEDCTSNVEVRTPWRRYFHHATFYGFALCFASTTVAAIYHIFFNWRAPYTYASLPVVLGTVGGIGLVVGPVGLLVEWSRRDPALRDPKQGAMDVTFIVMLLLVSVTGLLLLALRGRTIMPWLLVIHLGVVLGLFVTMPYGKFVHGIYRAAALLRFSAEAPR